MLTTRSFVYAALRLIAVYVVVTNMQGALYVFDTFDSGALILALPVVMGVGLWLLSGWLADTIVAPLGRMGEAYVDDDGDVLVDAPDTPLVAEPADAGKESIWQSVAFSVLGVWICVQAAPPLLLHVFLVIFKGRGGASDVSSGQWLVTFGSGTPPLVLLLQVVLGVLLFVKAANLSALWHRLRGPAIVPDADRHNDSRHSEPD